MACKREHLTVPKLVSTCHSVPASGAASSHLILAVATAEDVLLHMPDRTNHSDAVHVTSRHVTRSPLHQLTSFCLLSGLSQLPSTSRVRFSTSDWYVATRPRTAANRRGSSSRGPPNKTCARHEALPLNKLTQELFPASTPFETFSRACSWFSYESWGQWPTDPPSSKSRSLCWQQHRVCSMVVLQAESRY